MGRGRREGQLHVVPGVPARTSVWDGRGEHADLSLPGRDVRSAKDLVELAPLELRAIIPDLRHNLRHILCNSELGHSLAPMRFSVRSGPGAWVRFTAPVIRASAAKSRSRSFLHPSRTTAIVFAASSRKLAPPAC